MKVHGFVLAAILVLPCLPHAVAQHEQYSGPILDKSDGNTDGSDVAANPNSAMQDGQQLASARSAEDKDLWGDACIEVLKAIAANPRTIWESVADAHGCFRVMAVVRCSVNHRIEIALHKSMLQAGRVGTVSM